MPKIKTHKALADRIKITGSGKMMHKKAWRNHLLTNKGRSNKKFSYGKQLSGAHAARVKALLPYA